MDILGIDHIAIAVKDIEDAGAYLKYLGLEITHTEDVAEQGVKTASIELGNIIIELIQPIDDSANLNKFLEKRGSGFHHIALRVGDLPAVLDELKRNDVKLIDETPQKGAHGKKIAFVYPSKDSGILIELCED